MSTTFGVTRSIIKAVESAKASGEKHNVIVVHDTPDDGQACDIHYGSYTVEGMEGGPLESVGVKRVDGDHKKIVAYYAWRRVHAVYIVEGEQSKVRTV